MNNRYLLLLFLPSFAVAGFEAKLNGALSDAKAFGAGAGAAAAPGHRAAAGAWVAGCENALANPAGAAGAGGAAVVVVENREGAAPAAGAAGAGAAGHSEGAAAAGAAGTAAAAGAPPAACVDLATTMRASSSLISL